MRKPSKKLGSGQALLADCFMLVSYVFVFNPEDESSTFLRNVAELIADYAATHPRIFVILGIFYITVIMPSKY
jgi:hypothetical protein